MNKKTGLMSFHLDVDIFEDEKIQFVSARFGTKGEALIIRLLCKIYRQGYFTNWDEDIALLFSKGAGDNVSPSCANEVVNELVKRGFFDKSLLDRFSILTSRRIQRQYFEASRRRNEASYDPKYLLVDVSQWANATPINQNVNILDENAYAIIENVNSLKQSKVKVNKYSSPDIAGGDAAGEDSASHGKRKKRKHPHDSKHYKAAEWLAKRVIENTPRSMQIPTESQKQNWADTFRLMEECDKLEWDDIRDVLMWAVKDDFWCDKILSANNFRKHYNQLVTKMDSRKKTQNVEISGYPDADDVIREESEMLGLTYDSL